jgi:CRP/FNR family transcriptional regulator, dissimilatory nitrate respiration regulator
MPPPKIKTAAFLANLPLFRELPPAEIERLATGTTEVHVPRGTVLFSRGDPCTGFHLVVYGRVKLSVTSPAGSEKVVEIINPGFSFGEAVMFMERPYFVTAQTLADSMLLHVGRDVVFDGLARDPTLARRMLAGISRRLHGLVSDVESYTLKSGTQRVVGYLLRTDSEAAGESEDARRVALPVAKAVLASRLNLTPEHFSRILHELAEQGLIDIDGRNIEIRDLERLRGYGN